MKQIDITFINKGIQMSSFAPFAHLVKQKFDEMSKGELFIAGNGREVWNAYLAAFPEGTNPLYRERSEHDCECCKQFIRNIGNVVSIVDGKRTTIWDLTGLAHPYSDVVATMAKYVADLPIESLYRVAESKYGNKSTVEDLGGGQTKRWDHFYGNVSHAHLSTKVGTDRGEYAAFVQVFQRGLTELNPESLVTVIDLIADKNLYRGEEYLAGVLAFQKLQKQYNKLTTATDKNTFVWANASNRAASQLRSSVMGALLVDLSGTPPSKDNDNVGKPPRDLESSVAAFEHYTAPENFKRSKALLTPRMKADALQTIRNEGLEDSLKRRFAKLSDVSINNVLWADSAVQAKMKDGLESLLASAHEKPVKVDEGKAIDISIDEFLSKVLPQTKSMELFVKNSQINNFMSLTAPVYADSKTLFKWDNDFGWSYNGNITDSSLRQRVQSAGGRVDGVLRFSHTWNYAERNASLMDLHVFMPGSSSHKDGCHNTYPNGRRIGWNNRSDKQSGGVQDVDYTEAAPVGYVPVENITFPSLANMPEGKYTFKIHNWTLRAPTLGGFKAEIEFGGQVFQYEHRAPLKHHEWITVAEATLKNGQFTIDHKHAVGAASQEVWGVKTEKFVKVSTMMLSPNFWDEYKIGNKHWFFILDECFNNEPTRGIYNEFLHSGLEKHRKVLEVLGDLTKCEPTSEQLSGMGFSSTRGDTVLVKVAGPKFRNTYNITF